MIMSAEGWDLQVPRDASELAELWAAARRHGVEPGGHLRVVQSTPAPHNTSEDVHLAEEPQRRLRFAGVLSDAPSDLASNADRYLADGFGTR